MTEIPREPLITRKQISQMLGGAFSARAVGNHEKEWQLDSARANTNSRKALYITIRVVALLRRKGIILNENEVDLGRQR